MKTINILAPKGVRAIAYLDSDPGSTCRCTLRLKRSKGDSPYIYATLFVQFAIRPASASAEQTLTLLYHPENLVSGSNKINWLFTRQLKADLDWIGRDGQCPKAQTISLALKDECPVQRSPVFQSVSLEDAKDATFCSFFKLARAKKISILFDMNWLHKRYAGWFNDFFCCPEKFMGLQQYAANNHSDVVANWRSLLSRPEIVTTDDIPPYTPLVSNQPLPPSTFGADISMTASPLQPQLSVPLDPQMHQSYLNTMKAILPSYLQATLSEPHTDPTFPSPPTPDQCSLPAVISPTRPVQEMLIKPLIELLLQQLFAIHLPKLENFITDSINPLFLNVQQQLQDIGDDYVCEITLKKDDFIHEIERSACDSLGEFKDSLDGAVETLENHMSDRLVEIFDQRLQQSSMLNEEEERIEDDAKHAELLKSKQKKLKRLKKKQKKYQKKAKKLKKAWEQEERKAKSLNQSIKEFKRMIAEVGDSSAPLHQASIPPAS